MKPLLSICIPTFNRRDFLALCLARVFAQIGTRQDIEVIVSNNASTDGTEALLADLATRHAQLRFINRPVTIDVSLQFCGALLLSQGDWCVYLADDDLLKIDVILEHISAMRGQDDVAAIYTDWVAWDDLSEVELHRYFQVGGEKHFTLSQAPLLLDYLLSSNALPEIAVYRRSILDEALLNGVTESFYQILLGMLKAGTVVFRDPAFYYECRVTKSHLVRTHWANMDGGSTQIDGLRSGFENFALGALSINQSLPLAKQTRLALYDGMQGFLTNRLALFRQRALGEKNWRRALRIDDRIRLWYPEAALPLQSQNGQLGYADLVVWAALQSIVDRASMIPECKAIYLASPHLAGLEQVLRDMAGVFMVEVLSGEILFPCSGQALYVLHRQEDLDRFLGNGGARAAVLVMSRMADSLGSATKVVFE